MNKTNEEKREARAHQALNTYNISPRNRKYKIVKKLSSKGAFSSVYEVKDDQGNSMVMKAVDSIYHDINLDSSDIIKYTEQEISSMKLCKDSPYVMKLIDAADVCLGNPEDHIFLLFMPKLQVSTEYFIKTGFKISDIISMAKDVCKALEHCHSKHILHRDIKPENIYYSRDTGKFVLADFGISRSLFDHSVAITRIGSLIAPEIQIFQNLNGRMNSDIYSLGMTMLWLNAEMSNSDDKIAERYNKLNADVKAVIAKATDGDPAKRYQTAKELLADLERIKPLAEKSGNADEEKQKCVTAFINGDYRTAQEIAIKGHKMGIPVMSCLYSYILACQKKTSEALSVLKPLMDRADNVATGLYGIIGLLETIKNKPAKQREMVKLIEISAKNGFSVAQYYLGRWLIDGQNGYSTDMETGVEYIFKSFQRGFTPAMYYFRKTLKRHKDNFTSVESMMDLMEIMLKGFSEKNFPEETVYAIATAY